MMMMMMMIVIIIIIIILIFLLPIALNTYKKELFYLKATCLYLNKQIIKLNPWTEGHAVG